MVAPAWRPRPADGLAGTEQPASTVAGRPGAVDVHAHYLPERYREVASYHGHAHPDGMPGRRAGSRSPWGARPMIEFPFDSTRAVANLLLSGTLARCPNLQLVVPHAGGAVPVLAGRIVGLGAMARGLDPSSLVGLLRGLWITVTEHGRPIARLTSVAPDVDRRSSLIEAGIVRPAPAGRRRLPSKRVKLIGGEALADLVAEQRR